MAPKAAEVRALEPAPVCASSEALGRWVFTLGAGACAASGAGAGVPPTTAEMSPMPVGAGGRAEGTCPAGSGGVPRSAALYWIPGLDGVRPGVGVGGLVGSAPGAGGVVGPGFGVVGPGSGVVGPGFGVVGPGSGAGVVGPG